MIAIPYPLFDRVLTPAERRQMAADAKRHANLRRGHADYPGTGPEGETCGSCTHLARKQMAKTYLKCKLMESKWTGGGGTDVRARDPACSKWAENSGDRP